MIICGINLTHDASVALIDHGRLVFSIETEKMSNNPRYSELGDLDVVEDTLEKFGYNLTTIDSLVVSGWHSRRVRTHSNGARIVVPVASYRESVFMRTLLQHSHFAGLRVGGLDIPYRSYTHVASHLFASYCSSPFARSREESFVLVWDGTLFPTLYFVDPKTYLFQRLGVLFEMQGKTYARFAMNFAPFRPRDRGWNTKRAGFGELSIPGEVMAFTALGDAREEIMSKIDLFYRRYWRRKSGQSLARALAEHLIRDSREKDMTEADILASFQAYVARLIISGLKEATVRFGRRSYNLCLSGGCALNIKWNSAIRQSGLFSNVWIPPFANDTGSAIGVACAEMVARGSALHLDWDVYSGAEVEETEAAPGWSIRPCEIRELACILYEEREPVIVLNGRAELGPRALGNRSILAPAIDPAMKDHLNRIKQRQEFRPISPICLESRAKELFDPGHSDRYMLFDHQVRPRARTRIPAVVHLDQTARLQTIASSDNPVVWKLLMEYSRLSGVPVLCNTSANGKDRGFFPDVRSATSWGRTKYVWCNGMLYIRDEKSS
jgi:carbamoyltransferase